MISQLTSFQISFILLEVFNNNCCLLMETEEPTQRPAGTIRQISRGVVHQICSGQVVLSLATAAKVNIDWTSLLTVLH